MALPGPQQFNLRWNNHTSNILQVFLEQYTSELLVDVTISCQGKFLKAHKMVLSACSPYFQNGMHLSQQTSFNLQELFNHHDNPHPIIILYGMKFEDVKAIIEFMYRGEIKVLESELDQLLEVAESLQIKGLCNVRSKYVKGEIQKVEDGAPLPKKLKVTSGLTSWNSDAEGGSSTDDATEVLAGKEKLPSPPLLTVPQLPSSTSKLFRSPPMLPVVTKISRGPPAVVRVRVTNDYNDNDDDLPAMIKVEPPDIRDIDDDSPGGWESPRLVIDLPEIPPSKPLPKSVISRPRAKRLVLQGNSSRQRDTNLPAVTGFESRIPRPPNAFMVFANEWRRKLAYQHPTENNKEISVRLGFMWKSLPSEAKEVYYAASRQADLDHKQKYPGYYYSPKEARLRKRLKKRTNSATLEAMQLVRVLMKEDGNNTQAETSHG